MSIEFLYRRTSPGEAQREGVGAIFDYFGPSET
jgi:hypothetical protein